MRKGVFLLLSVIYVLLFSCCADAQYITTIAGGSIAGFSGDGGAATSASLAYPYGVAIDATGNLYIADYDNNRIRKINGSGMISTICGGTLTDYAGDGGPASLAYLDFPSDVAVDGAGNIYIADQGHSVVRKINTAGIISTFAGTGDYGFSGDGGMATLALLDQPTAVAIDRKGNVYIADYNNYRIRKVDTFGIITTFAGNGFGSGGGTGGYTGDGGPATAAELFYPTGVAADAAGNVYIADHQNNAVRKVDTFGIIATFAGTGTAGFTGDGGMASSAKLKLPSAVAVDAAGDVYISDLGNNRIRKVNTLGIITTIAGSGVAGYGGDGTVAANAALNNPQGITVDPSGKVYIADENNYRIRMISSGAFMPVFTGGASLAMSVCENAFPYPISNLLAIRDSDIGQTETWTVSTPPLHGTLSGFSAVATSVTGTITPTGLYYAPATGYSGADSFKIRISNGLASDTITIHVTINALPYAGIITGTYILCLGGPGAVTDATPGGMWSTNDTSLFISGDGVINATTIGNDTVSYIVTNSCGTAIAKKQISVIAPADPGTIYGPANMCVGVTDTLSSVSLTTVSDSALGIWSSSNSSAIITSAGVLTAISADTVTISYTVGNACGPSTATLGLTINALPGAGNITGLSSLCSGYAIILTDTAAGGNWEGNCSCAIISGGIMLGLSPGTDTVNYIVTNSCGADTATKIVTIALTPTVGNITGPTTLCAGDAIHLSDTSSDGTWSTSNAHAAIGGSGEIIGISSGIDTVKYIVANACGIAEATTVLTINGLPAPGPITGADTVCQTQTTMLTDSLAGGAWSSKNTLIANVSASGLVTGVAPGADSIIYTVANGCGTTKVQKMITVKSLTDCGLESNGVNTATATASGGLKLFPNPAGKVFNMIVSSAYNEEVRVIITNTTGQKVKELTVAANKETIITLNESPGIYFLSAAADHGFYTAKIVLAN